MDAIIKKIDLRFRVIELKDWKSIIVTYGQQPTEKLMRKTLKWITVFGLGGLTACLGTFTALYLWAARDLPEIKKITDYTPSLATIVYTEDKEILDYFFEKMRFLRSMDQISPFVPKAFIAAEDHGFFRHPGVDFTSIVRAAIANFKAGHIVQGGSTITQQVVDNLLLNTGTNYLLKFKEAILAYRLDKHLSKEQILTIYLNHIYLGEGAYGIEAASRVYFGKHASDLTLAEAALIAGLPKAPSFYNPYDNPQGAKHRQHYVLQRMEQLELITKNEYDSALQVNLHYHGINVPSLNRTGYFLQAVRKELIQKFGRERVFTGGLKVYTTIDLTHQDGASTALRRGLQNLSKRRGWRGPIKKIPENGLTSKLPQMSSRQQTCHEAGWIRALVTRVQKSGAYVRFDGKRGFIEASSMDWARDINPGLAPEEIPKIRDARNILHRGDVVCASIEGRPSEGEKEWPLALQQHPEVQGALVSLDPGTGQIKALVGGYSFSQSQFNRATQARRQPGSAFKPVVYSAALEEGYTAANPLLDAPVVMRGGGSGIWKPRNYSLDVRGKILLRTGLVHSVNLATIRLAQAIGLHSIIQQAKAMGLTGPFPHDFTLAIGSLTVTPLNLCRAYTTFARDGTTIDPVFISRVTDSRGNTLFKKAKKTRRVMSPQVAYIMTELLRQAVEDGTGWRVRALGRPAAGKTGTTNNQRDAWFVGYTPNLLTTVYVGFDKPSPLGRFETGSRAASPIWLAYMRSIENFYQPREFNVPQGIVMAEISAETGLLAGKQTGTHHLLPFRVGNEPHKIAKGKNMKTDLFKSLF